MRQSALWLHPRLLPCLLALCLLSSLVGCSKHESVPKQYQVKELPADFQIPKFVFENIKTFSANESKTALPVFVFLPIQVRLTGLQEGVVQDEVVQIQFPNGGGKLDLSKFLRKQGSFTFELIHPQAPADLELFDLVFVSNTYPREFEGEAFGLGCGRAVRLKAQYEKIQAKAIKVNTTDNRHLHVIGGQFIAVYKRANQYYLTHVNVYDSRVPTIVCQAIAIE